MICRVRIIESPLTRNEALHASLDCSIDQLILSRLSSRSAGTNDDVLSSKRLNELIVWKRVVKFHDTDGARVAGRFGTLSGEDCYLEGCVFCKELEDVMTDVGASYAKQDDVLEGHR